MTQPDPVLGVVLHAIGGLASASFYLPFRGVKALGVGVVLARRRYL